MLENSPIIIAATKDQKYNTKDKRFEPSFSKIRAPLSLDTLKMVDTSLSITSIGLLARKILSKANSASILGITSRGIFLKIDTRWIIFLSYEHYRGPLTLNLAHNIRTPLNIDPSHSIEIHPDAIVIPNANIGFLIQGAEDWIISPHPLPVLHQKEINHRIKSVSQEILTQRGDTGLTLLLMDLLQISFPRQSFQPKTLSINIQQIQKDLMSPSVEQVTSQMQKVIGLGSGLTPSGDDLISGFLLACNRYHDVISLPYLIDDLNQATIDLAYQKTSLLSANLIECATLGLADERLVLALDGILAGTMSPASCADQLLGWGNSSGCDAFLGMALAIIPPPGGNLVNPG